MTFSDAIEAVKDGKKVQRIGWNGKKQYLATKEDTISNLKAGTGISISEDGTISVSFETAEGNLF